MDCVQQCERPTTLNPKPHSLRETQALGFFSQSEDRGVLEFREITSYYGKAMENQMESTLNMKWELG